jgi:hypothetical protein
MWTLCSDIIFQANKFHEKLGEKIRRSKFCTRSTSFAQFSHTFASLDEENFLSCVIKTRREGSTCLKKQTESNFHTVAGLSCGKFLERNFNVERAFDASGFCVREGGKILKKHRIASLYHTATSEINAFSSVQLSSTVKWRNNAWGSLSFCDCFVKQLWTRRRS